jgi:hypothetical protein
MKMRADSGSTSPKGNIEVRIQAFTLVFGGWLKNTRRFRLTLI